MVPRICPRAVTGPETVGVSAVAAPGVWKLLANPKSRSLAPPRLGHKDVRGFDVAMDNAFFCAPLRAPSAISRARSSSAASGKRPPCNPVFSVWPSRNSMAMKAWPVLFANVVNGANVRMVQRRRGLGLLLEAGQGLWIAGHIVGQKLQSHETMQSRVSSAL